MVSLRRGNPFWLSAKTKRGMRVCAMEGFDRPVECGKEIWKLRFF